MTLEAVERIASRLLGAPVLRLAPVRLGGNNRLFRVESGQGVHALKCHLRQPHDPRDRQKTETRALVFLRAQGVTAIPRLVALDRESGCTLLEWIDGEPLHQPTAADVDAALALIRQLRPLGAVPEAERLPLASAACLSSRMLVRQVEDRFARLRPVLPDHPELAAFIREAFLPCMARTMETLIPSDELPVALRLLSPSDFGFHNALRTPKGEIVFLDFEYFGWDDPVKLTCDFLLHPGMNLADDLKERFVQGMTALCHGDRDFAPRLRRFHPLAGLSWCLILLNEFLQEGWERRAFAGSGQPPGEARQRQLAKARHLLATLCPG
ncbi:MAG: aminoglycoside phosphotransferase family protein [Magnetococcales bacterium]|nr:aminoglycoside phosphotransferase family protein [Magnetococcales bacterium]